MSQARLWNAYMAGYDFLAKVDCYQAQLQEVALALGFLNGKHILDAGSGTGNLSLLLKSGGAKVVSCDASPAALAQHRDKDPHARLLQGSLEDPLPLETGSFDGICCVSVLFALTRHGCQTALGEFHRLLRPGGWLVVTVPTWDRRNGQLLRLHFRDNIRRLGWVKGLTFSLIDFPPLLRTLYYGWRISRQPDWRGFHRFTALELRDMLEQSGFSGFSMGCTFGQTGLLVRAERT